MAMIRSGGLRGYQALVRKLGGDPLPLLRRHRIPPESLDDEDALIPLRALMTLLEETAGLLDCPDFGMRLAQTQDISILGPVAVAIQHSATAAEGLACASRYLFVHSPAIVFSVLPVATPAPGGVAQAELRFEVLLPDLPVARQSTELSLGVSHRMMQLLGREHYRLLAVCLPHSPVASPQVYARHFGAPVYADQPHASLLVASEHLHAPLREANDTLRQLAAAYLDVHFPAPGQTVASRVRLAISRSLGTGQASKQRVAQMLAMHPRTLQRHLEAEGTRFDSIRDEVLREAALRYLTASRMPLAQVAGILGLSEQSALTRVCRRWFGAPPSVVRREGARR
jgi:AraC-like DNA-binding protein